MADTHSPKEVSTLLGINPGTLRAWSQRFADLLDPAAAASGPTVRRRYTDSDIALLRQVQAQLQHGATYDQVRALLSPIVDYSPELSHSAQSVVTVLDERPEMEALRLLLDAQWSTLEAQRATLEAQGQLISQLQHEREQDRQTVSQIRQQSTIDKAVLTAQLAQANSQATEALTAIQGTLERIPRWLRALLRLGA